MADLWQGTWRDVRRLLKFRYVIEKTKWFKQLYKHFSQTNQIQVFRYKSPFHIPLKTSADKFKLSVVKLMFGYFLKSYILY